MIDSLAMGGIVRTVLVWADAGVAEGCIVYNLVVGDAVELANDTEVGWDFDGNASLVFTIGLLARLDIYISGADLDI